MIRFVGRKHGTDSSIIGVELTGDNATGGEHSGMVIINPLLFHRCALQRLQILTLLSSSRVPYAATLDSRPPQLARADQTLATVTDLRETHYGRERCVISYTSNTQ